MFERFLAWVRGDPETLSICQEAVARFERAPIPGNAIYQSIREISVLAPNVLEYSRLLERLIHCLKHDVAFRGVTFPEITPTCLLSQFYVDQTGFYLTPDYYSERFFSLACECLKLYDERSESLDNTGSMSFTLRHAQPLINNLIQLSEVYTTP